MEIQGISLPKIAEKIGTPFYIYDGDKIKQNVINLRYCLPKIVEIFYSLKANPNQSICRFLSGMNLGAEVCSHFELEIALREKFRAENIIFLGPGKKLAEIKRSLSVGIKAIVCESLNELSWINQLAKKMRKKARVAIRINPDFLPKGASLVMGGSATQFGINEHELNTINFEHYDKITVCGLHVYNGTRILSAAIIAENTKNILLLADRLARYHKINFEFIDVGGGIGIPYFDNEERFSLQQFKKLIYPIIHQFTQSHPTTKIILESGRYLVGNAGYFVTKIQQIKQSWGNNFIVTDGGMNCHLMAAGYGAMIKKNFPISVITASVSNTQHETYTIAGPLCTPADVIGKNITLPQVKIGDLIVVHESGAYGPTASPILFLGHGYPAEVLVKEKNAYLIRKRDSMNDMFRNQVNQSIHL
jgi:diaminopimelate decarboxylase